MPKLLIVEDNEPNRDMLSRRLRRKGFEVVIATDGLQGVTMALELLPDLILLDMSLPVMDGWTAARTLKADPKSAAIPIIALTAHAMASDRDKALSAGCDEYPLSAGRVVKLMKQIAFALDEAHSANVLHRDLKPENIMVFDRRKQRDMVKVLDFGIAKLNEATEETFSTQVGTVCGTPAYMSPEQAFGLKMDGRAGLYSLGVILYKVLTQVGCAHIETKPIDFESLIVKIRHCLPVPDESEADELLPSGIDDTRAVPLPSHALVYAGPDGASRRPLREVLAELGMVVRPLSGEEDVGALLDASCQLVVLSAGAVAKRILNDLRASARPIAVAVVGPLQALQDDDYAGMDDFVPLPIDAACARAAFLACADLTSLRTGREAAGLPSPDPWAMSTLIRASSARAARVIVRFAAPVGARRASRRVGAPQEARLLRLLRGSMCRRRLLPRGPAAGGAGHRVGPPRPFDARRVRTGVGGPPRSTHRRSLPARPR